MAIKFIDGCDTDDRDIKWNATFSTKVGWSSNGSNFGTGCLTAQVGNSYKYIPGINLTRFSLGTWFKAFPGSDVFVSFSNSAASQSISVGWDASNYMTFSLWGSGSAPGKSVHVWRDGFWHWLDLDIKLDATTGFINAYVDGYNEFSFTGNTIGSGTPSVERLYIGGGNSGPFTNWDDVIWYDDSAGGLRSSVNWPLTAQRIETIRPSADNTAQWTTSTGVSHFALVDKAATNTATYVQDNVSGHKDIYDYGNLSVTPNTILSVVCNDTIENSGTLAISYNPVIVSGGVEYDGTAVNLFNSYMVQQTEYQVNPNGSIAWTKSAVDAALFGVKVP